MLLDRIKWKELNANWITKVKIFARVTNSPLPSQQPNLLNISNNICMHVFINYVIDDTIKKTSIPFFMHNCVKYNWYPLYILFVSIVYYVISHL